MSGRFLFLGTGGSMGIPIIGCDCPVCTSDSPFNKRLRPSGLISFGPQNILIDAGPDFRYQALRYGIKTLDGLMLTHAHHDHTAGVDELRVFFMRNHQPIPCLMSKETFDDLKVRFAYLFIHKNIESHLTVRFAVQCLQDKRGLTTFLGHKIRYFSYDQMEMSVNGYKIGNLAYVSDIHKYPETIFEDLQGTETLILSALRFTPSPLHFSVDEAIAFAKRVGAKNTWLTHISHDLDYDKTESYLPENIRLAYDGLTITFEE